MVNQIDAEWISTKRKFKQKIGGNFTGATLGGYGGNGQPIIDEPTMPGFVHVRIPQANGELSQSIILPFRANMIKKFGAAVQLAYDVYGVLVVKAPDTGGQQATGDSTLGNNASDPNVTHYIQQQRIITLNSHPISSSSASMLVTIQNWLWIENGIVHYFLGGSDDGTGAIDLEPYIPASADTHGIVCLFIKTDNTPEIIASTPIDTGIPLDPVTPIQECLDTRTAGSKPVWAWYVYNGQIGITPGDINSGGDDFMDLRQFINVSDGGDSFSLTVTDGSTTVTEVTDIEFNAADFTVTDLGGGAVQIDSVGGGAVQYPTRLEVAGDVFNQPDGTPGISIAIRTSQLNNFFAFQTTAANGDSFTLSGVLAAGTYTLYVIGCPSTNRGIIDYYLDGAITGVTGQDWRNGGGELFNVIKTGSITIATDGYHVIKGLIVGTSGGAGDYLWAITKIALYQATD